MKLHGYLAVLAVLTACLGLWYAEGPPAAGATGIGVAPDDTLKPNRLIHEKSPYLLQHAYNPVDWYPWGEAAFEKARREDKPIFLSIGYSTCHWCHVMERESFEDSTVAALLNSAFVAVKVDREERPDIDHIYMDVAQRMNGRGGWPLNIVMTPDQQPFFAGTYFPRQSRGQRIGMLDLIPRLQTLWTEKRDQVLYMSAQVQAALQPPALPPAEAGLTAETLEHAFDALDQRFDSTHAGFGPAPKFPRAHDALFLLRYAERTGNPRATAMVEATLQALRRGGIYDHIGFGFHRYATDAKWLVPHFEKMLYDQALLALAYTEAYQATGTPLYARTAHEILSYVLRDMTGPEGGFYSAEDADSEEEEGKFYLWTLREVQAALPPEDARLAAAVFNLSAAGNYVEPTTGARTGANILHRTQSLEALAAQENLTVQTLTQRLETIRQTLFDVRMQRIPPYKDDKILTDWNGLMIAALAKAARVLDAPAYAAAAGRAAEWLWANLRDDQDRLLHRYRAGEAAHLGNLDDYAAFTWGLLELYETTFDVRFLEGAIALQAEQDARFSDGNGGYFFTPSDGEPLLIRPQKWEDGAWPSGQSISLMNLLRLGKITAEPAYETRADALLRAAAPLVQRGPAWYTHLQQGLAFALGPTLEVVVAGAPEAADTRAMLQALRSRYVPHKVVLLRPPGDAPPIAQLAPFTRTQRPRSGQATAYVCRSYACELPTTDVDQMLELLEKARK